MADLRAVIHSRFKLNGLGLSSDASKFLQTAFSRLHDRAKLERAVDKVVASVLRQPLERTVIDREVCETAVRECRTEASDSGTEVLSVIDAFQVPRFDYLADRKKFVKASGTAPLFDQADSKTRLFRERFQLVQLRTVRHELFAAPIAGASESAGQGGRHFRLQPVEFLLGTTGRLRDVLILGMLTQLREGHWFLEDPTGVVRLDFSGATFHKGLFPEAALVLTEGWYEDKIFHVTALGLPPAEAADQTRDHFGLINFFGGPGDLCARANPKLVRLEAEAEDAMVLLLTEVHLDSEEVLEKLGTLFSGFAQSPPLAIVLCGNFASSVEPAASGLAHYRVLFRRLARLMAAHGPLVEQTRLLLVPGPSDLGLARLLPRPGLPKTLETELRARLPLAQLVSNPVRLRCYTQELVIFREDLSAKMARHCLHTPREAASQTGAWAEHLARTIVSQGHLCPLPLHISPVFWAHDAALRLYPLPDVVVLADRTEAFTVQEAGGSCLVTNPGPFSPAAEFAFKVYYPRSRQVEDSKIG